MDTITSLVGVLETALEGGEPTTALSSLNALYALYALQNRAEAAEVEVGRLQAALDQWKQRCDAIMLCATGRAAPLSDWDVCGEIVRLRERVALEAEAKRTLAALRLAEQFVAKANADGAYTNTAMSGDRALAKINAALYGDSDQDAR